MSRPTEIMFVAIAQSTRSVLIEGLAEAAPRLGNLVGRHSRGQLDYFGERLAVLEEPALFTDTAALTVAADRVADLLLEDPPGAAQLAQAVEVPEDRHVRVGGVLGVLVAAGVAVGPLGGTHQREPDLAHHDLGVAALGGDTDVATRRSVGGGHRASEERVAPVRTRRREDLCQRAAEQRLDLVLRASHRRRRGDDLRSGRTLVEIAHAEPVDRRLVQARHRSERTRDQVKLVLDDEIGRRQRRAERLALPGSAAP